jgi:hypothetical protein
MKHNEGDRPTELLRAEKWSKVMKKLEAICVTTDDERIVKMLKKKGVCKAILLTDSNGMAYVLTEMEEDMISMFRNCETAGDCQRRGKGIVVPLYDIIGLGDTYALVNDDCVATAYVDVVNENCEEKSVKNIRNSLEYPLSRNELCDMLGIPVVSMTHWDYTDRKPSKYLVNLLECWLRSEGYLKRRFTFGLKTYDEDTTEYDDVLDWDWQDGYDIYADTVQEAMDMALDFMLENTGIYDNRVTLSDLDDDDMIVFHDACGCGLYHEYSERYIDKCGNITRDELPKPYTFGDGKLLWGIKRIGNSIGYYRFVEYDDDPKEYRCELARKVYFGVIREHILENF